MAIKRIVPKFERKAKICLKCGAKLKRVRNNEAVKCEKCGTVHLIKFTEHGNVVLTDKKYQHLFDCQEDEANEGDSEEEIAED